MWGEWKKVGVGRMEEDRCLENGRRSVRGEWKKVGVRRMEGRVMIMKKVGVRRIGQCEENG